MAKINLDSWRKTYNVIKHFYSYFENCIPKFSSSDKFISLRARVFTTFLSN